MQYVLAIFILWSILVSGHMCDELVVCRSINLQGLVDSNRLSRIRNCSVVLGHVRILNARFYDDWTNISALFPNLIEITDYLLIFQAQNVNSLDQLFPKLTLIRGDKLFKSYALIVFLTNSLVQLNLKRLVEIRNGSILLSRLYHSCYVHTIDWDYILKNRKPHGLQQSTINLINNNCFGQVCAPSCDGSNCWSEKNCQLKCPNKCDRNCNLDNPSRCCSNQTCNYCTDSSDCLICSSLRDLTTGQCVDHCNSGMLMYEQHSCVRFEDCSRETNSLVKGYFVLEGTQCVRICPNGYRESIGSLNLVNNSQTIQYNKCVPCEDGICKRDCVNETLVVKGLSDLDSVRNCFRIGRLTIELGQDVNQQLLMDSFRHLVELDDYLLVTRNRHLQNLNFLANLRQIHGRHLFESKYSLFVHTNTKLNELWEIANLTVLNGTIKFFENPQLCYQDIENFLMRIESSALDTEISYNFNGYKRFTCSNRTIELKFQLEKLKINVGWNVTISDLRRLKGYFVYYSEVGDKDDEQTMMIDYEADSIQSYNRWNYVYIQYAETHFNREMNAVIECRPYVRYALYVKADLMIDNTWSSNRTSFEYDRVISKINYVISLPAQPSRVESIDYELISYDTVNLKWKPPKRPNGIIDFYFVAYTLLSDMEKFEIVGDNCQYDRYLMESNEPGEYPKINDQLKQSHDQVKKIEKDSKIEADKKTDLKQLCGFGSDYSQIPTLDSELNDDDTKNDIISVEDEIYNLAFRPSKARFAKLAKLNMFNSTVKPANLTTNPTVNQRFNSSHDEMVILKKTNMTGEHFNQSLIDRYFNLDEALLRLVRKDLFIQDDEKLYYESTPNSTFNLTLRNMVSFGRYIVSVIACQNYTTDMLINAKRQLEAGGDLVNYLRFFSMDTYCSKSSLLTFRSLPDHRLDRIEDVKLIDENDYFYFRWSKPTQPNGFIYKYNLRFIDVNLNKTQGPLCHASLDTLKVPLNQFLLTEGHIYLIQVQAVSNAGPGPWSVPAIEYHVPSLSQYYIMLASEILGSLILILVVLIIVFVSLRKYYRSKEKGYFSIKNHYYYFRPDEWEIKRENLIIGERIGSGCFAEVHKGKLVHEKGQLIDCAIKFCGSDHLSRQRLLKEANMMKSINTTHIVKMLGVISRDNPAYLILEFMDKGDLKEFLVNQRSGELKCELTVDRFYRMAAEIADGMLWLSEHKYIHRDLAARNCLISINDVIKIADLGLSKDIYQNPVYREKCKALLPIRWMSPESLTDGSSTTKSDVWSYGVVLWELATYGENPYCGRENEEVIQFVKGGGRLELPSNAPAKFSTVFNGCMITQEYERIDFKTILDILDPDLGVDFKQTSYYHNDFKNKLLRKKLDDLNSVNNRSTINTLFESIKILEPYVGDSDNYM